MHPSSLLIRLLSFALISMPITARAQNLIPIEKEQERQITWYNSLDIGLTGQHWDDLENPFDRLPDRAKDVVRDPVWRLGTNTVRYDKEMWHMTNAGIKGLDLSKIYGVCSIYPGEASENPHFAG